LHGTGTRRRTSSPRRARLGRGSATTKFLILDLKEAEHTTLLGLAGAALALGAVYWLVREQDRRDEAAAGERGG
jgi:hypothetical protein